MLLIVHDWLYRFDDLASKSKPPALFFIRTSCCIQGRAGVSRVARAVRLSAISWSGVSICRVVMVMTQWCCVNSAEKVLWENVMQSFEIQNEEEEFVTRDTLMWCRDHFGFISLSVQRFPKLKKNKFHSWFSKKNCFKINFIAWNLK